MAYRGGCPDPDLHEGGPPVRQSALGQAWAPLSDPVRFARSILCAFSSNAAFSGRRGSIER